MFLGGGFDQDVSQNVYATFGELSLPVRAVVAGLAVALNTPVPLPLPLAPDVIVNQEVVVEAVHAQLEAEVTPTFPVDAVGPTVAAVDDRV